MPQVDVPWPTSNNPGSATDEGQGRNLNCYAYVDAGGPRWRPVPGLPVFASIPAGEVRGGRYDAGSLILVVGSTVVQIDSLGNITTLEGQLSGNGPVTIARNNAAPPQTVIVSNSGTFLLSNGIVQPYPSAPPTGPDGITYTSLPQVNSVSFLDGYFLFTTSAGQMLASDLNSTNVEAESVATAEARSDPLLRGVVYGQQFFAMGAETIEVWQDAGNLDFPLTRSTVIPIGLLSPWAVAGHQDGWSGPLIFVAQDASVRLLDGYTPKRISSDDLEDLIDAVADPTTLRASIYTFGGNAIWSLSSPTWTWEYNFATGLWHERQSYGQQRWCGDVTISAFGDWVVSDINGGQLYNVDESVRGEGSLPLIWGQDSGPVKSFPARIAVRSADFDFVLGQAPSGDTPDAMLSWSHDGGGVWSNPPKRSLGMQGRTRGRVSLFRIGLTSPAGVRFRYRVSDPAYSSFAGAKCIAEGRR